MKLKVRPFGTANVFLHKIYYILAKSEGDTVYGAIECNYDKVFELIIEGYNLNGTAPTFKKAERLLFEIAHDLGW